MKGGGIRNGFGRWGLGGYRNLVVFYLVFFSVLGRFLFVFGGR